MMMLEPLESRTFMSAAPLIDVMSVAPVYRRIHAIVAPLIPYNVWVGRSRVLTISDSNHDGRVDSLDFSAWYRAMWNGVLSPAAQAYWRGVRR